MVLLAAEVNVPLVTTMAKAMSYPLRLRIMSELNTRPMSPTLFSRECNVEGHSNSAIAKHFRKLAKWGLAEPFERKTGKQRHGGVEVFYRAAKHVIFDEEVWPQVPAAFRGRITADTHFGLTKRIQKAFEADTIDARDDRHFTWTAFLLDEQGWKEMIALIDGTFSKAFKIAEGATDRMKDSGTKPIHTTVGLIAIESPEGDQPTSE